MRFLSKYREIESIVGVDISSAVVEKGRARCEEEGITNVEFRCEDACKSTILSDSADFVWGEDAWCYVPDKSLLIKEAVRIVRPGGTIAFTDWVDGVCLADSEREFLYTGMRFPNLETRDGYSRLLEENGCEVVVEEDTGLFGRQVSLVAEMLDTQFRWDALRLTSFDEERVDLVVQALRIISEWGAAGKIEQARMVARKP
jgi:SAM-dependent methyltransferase